MTPLVLTLAAVTSVPTGVPGGVVAVPVPANVVEARYNDAAALLYRRHALVGLPLDAEPSRHHIVVRRPDGASERLPFDLVPKDYPVQRLTIPNPRHVNPAPEDLARIKRERVRMDAAYAMRSVSAGDPHPFVRPVAGAVSGAFGRRRILNGEPRSPHRGLDIAAPTGTPIVAPAPARVAVTGDFFFNGLTVLLDHGGGLVSLYCHLDEIQVREGDSVARGEAVGTLGATGRATGPHLHWTVALRGVMVDPVSFTDTVARLNAPTQAE